MKLLVDIQCLQTKSKKRGIGHFAKGFLKALSDRQWGSDFDLHVLYNTELDRLESDILQWIGRDCVHSFNGSKKHSYAEEVNGIKPDVLLLPSLLAEYDQDIIYEPKALDLSVKLGYVVHDFFDHDILIKNKQYSQYLDYLKKADLLFPNSKFTSQECKKYLGNAGFVIYPDIQQELFQSIDRNIFDAFVDRYGISDKFIFYCGGHDDRKNVWRLLSAYASFPEDFRSEINLVIAGGVGRYANYEGTPGVVLTQALSSEELAMAYRKCHLFVFPSLFEGFGLPVLEALKLGAIVVASKAEAVSEVLNHYSPALFDPYNDEEIAEFLYKGCTDNLFRLGLNHHQRLREKDFSWNRSISDFINAINEVAK